MIIINPGSNVSGGTLEQALINAQVWLDGLHRDGMKEVVIDPDPVYEEGRWSFTFRHTVTEKTALLETHGLTEEETHKLLFMPRVYWNGSSTADPSISDFLPSNWTYSITYHPPK